jgi:hypothetical protein
MTPYIFVKMNRRLKYQPISKLSRELIYELMPKLTGGLHL